MTIKLITSFVLAFLFATAFGKYYIPWLRAQKAGQEIKGQVEWHKSKSGTPTMGGVMFILAVTFVCLTVGFEGMLQGNFVHIFVLLFAWVFGLIGFLDDWEKLKKKQNLGLTAKMKFLLQLVAALVFVLLMREIGYVRPNLYIPFSNKVIPMPEWLYFVFASFVIVGTVNAVNITDGIQYCFDYAESVGKPCVVNISLGSHLGPHDGTSASDQAFAAMAGPGRIIVGAAGNEGSTALHVGKDLEEGDTSLKTMIGFSENSASKQAYVDIWGSKGAPLKVKAVVVDALKGKVMYESPAVETDGETDVKYTFPDGSGVVSTVQMALQKNPTNERTEVMLMCRATSIAENRKIGIVATSDAGTSIHMWNNATEGYFLNGGKRGWTEGDTDYTVGELGGVSDNVISVGSYNTKMDYTTLGGDVYGINTALVGNKGALSLFSSHGPTLDGRTKPDVTAPGCLLISATSKYYAGFSSSTCAVKSGDDYYDANMGTSMASPVVTGTVALWLQANPNLSPADVRAILNKTARHDNYTGTAEKSDRNSWGAGKIDAFAGLKMALDATGIKDTKADEQMFSITTDRVARTAQFFFGTDGAARVAVYNALGQQVCAKQLAASGEKVDLSQLGNGVFVVKLQQGSAEKSVKIAL